MFFYNLSIRFFVFGVRLAAPFNRKARLWINGRKGIFRRLEKAFGTDEKIVWVHAASLGEFEQGRPIIEAIKRDHPEYKVLLTFFSPSGYEVRRDYRGADHIFYLPADTPRNARRFMKAVKPEIAIFIKYEFWLNYLREIGRSDCRAYLVSAIFQRNSVFFKWYGGAYRAALSSYRRIFVQRGESEKLLRAIGVRNVTEAGDTRFDRVAAISRHAKRNETVEKFKGNSKLIVGGSTWPQDEEMFAYIPHVFKELKVVIVPHEVEGAHIDKLMNMMPAGTVRYSAVDKDADLESAKVLIIDTIGMLSSLYRYAHLAYIGGGFGAGIHNTLEAATFGIPVAFGPRYHKFKEARDMIGIGCAVSVRSEDQLLTWITELLRDEGLYESTCEKAAGYVASNLGATDMVMKEIFG